MGFLDRCLEVPSYGYLREGKLYVPTKRELFAEFLSRINLMRTRKNWLPLFAWFTSLVLAIPLVVFLAKYFSWWLAFAGFIYSMVILGTHGTVWYHRYATHRAYRYSNRFWRFVAKNLVVKIVIEEAYVVSHYVHHKIVEQPGDPYNVRGGWLYCFLADANHQLVARDLSPADYRTLSRLIDHTGVRLNSYAQYRKWGSICHPARTLAHFALNWAFWYGVFYLLGGHALATVLFGASFVWALGVRTFNYSGHGGGKDKRKEGSDFNRKDLSINQLWPGLVTGEWHNNHHLYPNGARAGFLPYQFDTAWLFIRLYHFIGGISTYNDFYQDFMTRHYLPYRNKSRVTEAKKEALASSPCPTLR